MTKDRRVEMKRRCVFLGAITLLCIVITANVVFADTDNNFGIVLAYHKLTGEPLDLNGIAQRSDAVQHASSFDRPDVIKSEVARLENQLNTTDAAQVFTLSVNDGVSDYDHDRGEFSILLFRPGYYVPIDNYGQQYKVVFDNAESARSIPMPKEEARIFDTQLSKIGRSVINEVHFRITGKGDPSGAVTGERVIRAEIVSDRLLDREGHVLFTPHVKPYQASTETAAGGFNLALADVSGFRVGVKAKDLAASLTRLFGPVTRAAPGKNNNWFAGALEVNSMGCFSFPGSRRETKPGAVCVTAFYDSDDTVRSIRIERVFSWLDGEAFRKALVAKYGPVATAKSSGDEFSLGWGSEVDSALAYESSGPHNALTAYYVPNDTYLTRGMNALPQIRIVLSLVDAQWASGHRL